MALSAIRSTSRRSESPDRMDAVRSSWSRSRRVTGWLLGRSASSRVCPDDVPVPRAAPMVGPGRDPGRRVGGHSGRGYVAGVEIDLLDGPRPRVAQPWLARAFFLR